MKTFLHFIDEFHSPYNNLPNLRSKMKQNSVFVSFGILKLIIGFHHARMEKMTTQGREDTLCNFLPQTIR